MGRPSSTGLPRGRALWDTPELRAAVLAKRCRPLSARLAKFTIRRGDHECWGWSGCHNGVGYPVLRVDKKIRVATQIALEVDGRPKPDGEFFACHRCDNPICTNPAPLYWGTRKENAQDYLTRGRFRKEGHHAAQ